MIRKAAPQDIPAISKIYDRIHDREEQGLTTIGWIRDVYPTEATARAAMEKGELFVMEKEGIIVAAAKINKEQDPAYALAHWEHPAAEEEVMVLHTLVVDPAISGKGLGTEFVAFYEAYALENGCPCLRMDTNARNLAARALYKKLGYKEVGIVPCRFNGIPGVNLVCLEKKL